MTRKCPNCDETMTALFTSFVCDTCEPAGGVKIAWYTAYVPVYMMHEKKMEGCLVDSIWNTLENAKKAIKDVYGGNAANPQWTVVKVKLTQPIVTNNCTGSFLYRMTKDVSIVIGKKVDIAYSIPFIHLIGRVTS